jgi:hypothetical protein
MSQGITTNGTPRRRECNVWLLRHGPILSPFALVIERGRLAEQRQRVLLNTTDGRYRAGFGMGRLAARPPWGTRSRCFGAPMLGILRYSGCMVVRSPVSPAASLRRPITAKAQTLFEGTGSTISALLPIPAVISVRQAVTPSPQKMVGSVISVNNSATPQTRSSLILVPSCPKSAVAHSSRPASIKAQTWLPDSRYGKASKSRLLTPTIGFLLTKARPFAALIPTRSALNPPGPKATATPLKSEAVRPTCPRIWPTAGISSVVWL